MTTLCTYLARMKEYQPSVPFWRADIATRPRDSARAFGVLSVVDSAQALSHHAPGVLLMWRSPPVVQGVPPEHILFPLGLGAGRGWLVGIDTQARNGPADSGYAGSSPLLLHPTAALKMVGMGWSERPVCIPGAQGVWKDPAVGTSLNERSDVSSLARPERVRTASKVGELLRYAVATYAQKTADPSPTSLIPPSVGVSLRSGTGRARQHRCKSEDAFLVDGPTHNIAAAAGGWTPPSQSGVTRDH